jgi:hypothetical protein
MSKNKITIVAALIIASILVIGYLWFPGLELPPSLIPPASYEPKSIEKRITQLNALTAIHDPNGTDYRSAVEQIIGEHASPEDLAMLAIWAEQHDPWISLKDPMHYHVFYTSVFRLGKSKDPRSKYALWKVRNSVALSGGHFDAQLAEVLDEMQEQQNGH